MNANEHSAMMELDNQESASELLGLDGPFARALPGYEHRPSQLEMADAVEDALSHGGISLVEAGTGTGKTLAYLVPAILSGRRVVISTGTRALQDQIVEQDLPLIERHIGRRAEVAVMKGLSNYLCLRRYEELRASPESMERSIALRLPMLERFVAESTTGDRVELEELEEESALWARVMSGSDTRIGPRCDHYDECFITAMRRRAEAADVVIVNHHLFFADLALRRHRRAGVLPEYEAVIFDEAHQIENAATNFFGVSLSTSKLERLARDAERVLDGDGRRLAAYVLAIGADAFGSLPPREGPDGGRQPLAPETLRGPLGSALYRLDNALEALELHTERSEDNEAVLQIGRRARTLRDDIAIIMESEGTTRIAYSTQRARTRTIESSPVDIRAIMRDELFHRAGAVVLTSATLSTSGNFEFIKRRLGIDFEVSEVILSSPFDYGEQAALYLPDGMPDPRDPTYLDRAVDEIGRLIESVDGGAFVLSTSLRMMRLLSQRIGHAIETGKVRCGPSPLVLTQGEAPKNTLLERFRAHGRAVLVATSTFWEGVDVPGSALRLVVIDKLPFDVPTDPLIAARCRRIKDEGEEPFSKYVVPSAALMLKQGFGRLVRKRTDRGVVAILDARLVTKGYGKVLLRSLPDATRTRSLAELQRFLGGPEASTDSAIRGSA